MISIVIPTYNQSRTLTKAIDSVLEQSFQQFELIVSDAGSSDGTLEVLQRYSNHPKIRWMSEPDQGQSHAINKGLGLCTGEIFNWLNSDDYLAPGALQSIADAFAGNPRVDIVSGYTDEIRDPMGEVFNRTQLQIRNTVEETITVGVYCQPSTFWRTNVVRDLGGLRQDLHYCMDTDLWIKYLILNGQGRVKKIEKLLAYYRHHPESKTSKYSERFYKETQLVFDNLHANLGETPAFLALHPPEATAPVIPLRISGKFDRQRYFGKYCERIVRIERTIRCDEARRWLWRSFLYKPWLSVWRLKMAVRLSWAKLFATTGSLHFSPMGQSESMDDPDPSGK